MIADSRSAVALKSIVGYALPLQPLCCELPPLLVRLSNEHRF